MVGELALDLIFGSEILILIEPEAFAKKVCYKQSRVTLVRVALNKIVKRFMESPYSGSDIFSRIGLPLRRRSLRVSRLAGINCLNHWCWCLTRNYLG